MFQTIKRLYAVSLTRRHIPKPGSVSRATVWLGKTGPDVTRLRTMLRHVAGRNSQPMGLTEVFDSQLERVVKAFQRDHSLTPDGVVGKLTWTCLDTCDFSAQPVAPPKLDELAERWNSFARCWLTGLCGYLSNRTNQNGNYPNGPMRISKGSAAQVAAARLRGKPWTHGMTCGHLQTFVAYLFLLPGRVADLGNALWCHTGMNLDGGWKHRAPWLKDMRRSNVTVAILDGNKDWIEAGGTPKQWHPRCRGFALDPQKRALGYPGIEPVRNDGTEYPYVIVERGSHVVGRLVCTGLDGWIEPTTGELLPAGEYFCASNNGSEGWVFRRWRESDGEGAIAEFGIIPLKDCGPMPVRAWMEG